jgi:uncharacterized protein YciI
VVVCHVTVETSADYLVRREPHRRAHVERLAALRRAGRVVGGGPAPDGRRVDLVYRLAQPDELRRLVEEDPYWAGGAWIGYASRSFEAFVEPWAEVPVVVDGSRRATIAEGPTGDPDLAQFALIELRGTGRLAFGGLFPGGDTFALLTSADVAEATGWLTATGFWGPGTLRARPILWVL